jgi:hypothetical protein
MKASATTTRNRQIAYAIAILVLFTLMYPYTAWLDSVKARKELGEATLGQIDTGSFVLKLALIGGFRGVAADLLWTRAEDYKKAHEWDKLKQTVDMITKLQPHFLSVWTYQGWNLAYNVSAEWDDPADKYQWVKQGIDFIRDGVDKNQKSPDLLWDTAWTYYHKVGFADEAIILRKMFYEDEDEDFKLDVLTYDDSQRRVRTTQNDNFQVAHGWFTRSVRLVDAGEQRLAAGGEEAMKAEEMEFVDKPVQHKGRPGDLGFRQMPAHAQTRYATALEKASIKDHPPSFGERAMSEWQKAVDEWHKFGTYDFPAHNDAKLKIHLDDMTDLNRFRKLSDNAQYWTQRWSNDTNYRYWKDHALAERERQGVQCRQLFYEATVALRSADFAKAVDNYKRGLDLWKDLLDRHTTYRDDQLNQKDTGAIVRRYVFALKQLGEPIPENMPFMDIYKALQGQPVPPDPFDALDMIRTQRKPAQPQGAGGAPPSQ